MSRKRDSCVFYVVVIVLFLVFLFFLSTFGAPLLFSKLVSLQDKDKRRGCRRRMTEVCECLCVFQWNSCIAGYHENMQALIENGCVVSHLI